MVDADKNGQLFIPDWATLGKAAGNERNTDIVNADDQVLA